MHLVHPLRASALATLSALPPDTAGARLERPDDFVDMAELAGRDKGRHIQIDIRYATRNNFIGRPVAGYRANKCLLTRAAAQAALRVIDELAPFGLTLRFLDAYRPQRAVEDFIAWMNKPSEEAMKAAFYPDVDKRDLIRDGYLAARSSHSRGSAVDVVIAPIHDAAGEALDFGTPYDYFGPQSHPSYPALTGQQKANRLLLRILMMQAGFLPIDTEWWHFQLADEPYPETYFDFPVV